MSQPPESTLPEQANVGELLAWARQRIKSMGSQDPSLEARLLLMSVTSLSHTDLVAHPELAVTESQLAAFESALNRRLRSEPVQYITGKTEFFGRQFAIDSRVLIPRPETELLVEQALAWINTRSIDRPRLLDIGTGSGILAVTLAAELDGSTIVATDISSNALEVAAENAMAHGVEERVEFVRCSIAEGVAGRFDLVVSNPPYVLSGFLDGQEAQSELAFEPREALDGGQAGMDVYSKLILALPDLLEAGGAAYVEIDPPVAEQCLDLAEHVLPQADVSILTDLAGLERCLAIELAQ